MVHRSDQLDGLDPEKQAVRIGASVGNRKRSRIHERADELVQWGKENQPFSRLQVDGKVREFSLDPENYTARRILFPAPVVEIS